MISALLDHPNSIVMVCETGGSEAYRVRRHDLLRLAAGEVQVVILTGGVPPRSFPNSSPSVFSSRITPRLKATPPSRLHSATAFDRRLS